MESNNEKTRCCVGAKKIDSYVLINASDIKKMDENGVVLKRKYGKFKRDVFGYINDKKENNGCN